MSVHKSFLLALCLLAAALSAACQGSGPTATGTVSPTDESTRTTTFTPPPSHTPSPTLPPTGTATSTSTPALSATATSTSTPAPTATAIPTYARLRGKVTIDQAVCHYGPGAPYLYKYGVYKGSNLEILRRVEYGNYIEIQAIGCSNPCWVRQDYLDNQGDLLSLEPVSAADVRLPISPYYAPLTGVSARRDGDVVTVFWHPLPLRPGDDSEQVPYILEAWVCQDGQYVFLPVGSYQTAAEVRDEPGCSLPSHGFVTAAEKHGYTRRVEIPWPPHGTAEPAPTATR